MKTEDVKVLIENYAKNAYIPHDDHTKCGQCWKEKIKSEVAKEFLQAGKLEQQHLKEMFEEIDKRWQQTALFLRVKEMRAQGMTLEKIAEQLEMEGIEV